MIRHVGCRCNLSRRDFSIAMGVFALSSGMPQLAEAAGPQTLDERFEYLSTHGNSTCSPAFTDSIAKMSTVARLQGSCCSPMDRCRSALNDENHASMISDAYAST